MSWVRDHSHGRTWEVAVALVIFGIGGFTYIIEAWSWRTRRRPGENPRWLPFRLRGDRQRVHPLVAAILGITFLVAAIISALTLVARALA